MVINIPRGLKDILPNDVYKWHYIEKNIRRVCSEHNYNEIRTPVFEHTELFLRGVGETTDIVQKEMYTFEDKGGRSITLKPEGTAGVVRSFIEGSLYAGPQPTKVFYLTPVFRYEKPQAGRLREHHQFGVEVFGSPEPSIDAEIISLAMTLFKRLNINNLELNINSIGCPKCRSTYNEILKSYLKSKIDELCLDCKQRLDKNPMRILDCKKKHCGEIVSNAPIILDSICDECSQHFNNLQEHLKILGYKYKINPLIVRGLDYYTKTVFEVVSKDIGSQGTVCGGGRYDDLVRTCGGPDVPAVGFGMGLERLILTMQNQGVSIPEPDKLDVFIISIGEIASLEGFKILYSLRKEGIIADMNHITRSIKAQFKYADKIGVKYTIVIGEDELRNDQISVKNMITGMQQNIKIEQIISHIKQITGRIQL